MLRFTLLQALKILKRKL